jgi:hypothetical protein
MATSIGKANNTLEIGAKGSNKETAKLSNEGRTVWGLFVDKGGEVGNVDANIGWVCQLGVEGG